MKSADLLVEHSYDEPVPPVLVLSFVADVGSEEWSRAHKEIVRLEVEMEQSWTNERRVDWQKNVYLSLLPLRI